MLDVEVEILFLSGNLKVRHALGCLGWNDFGVRRCQDDEDSHINLTSAIGYVVYNEMEWAPFIGAV